MKRTPIKRPGTSPIKVQDLKKPFGFCCDVKSQDPETQYDMRNPPFASSLENIVLNGGGPDIKFRVQEVGRPPYPLQWGKKFRPKDTTVDSTFLGECKRCRGPLRWYLEDEVLLAKNMLATERQAKYNLDAEKNVSTAIRKAKKHKQHKRQTKLKGKERKKDEAVERDDGKEDEKEREKNITQT